jgi:hypothetical protein
VRRKQRRSNAEWSYIVFAYNVISTQRRWKSAGFLFLKDSGCKMKTVTFSTKIKIKRGFLTVTYYVVLINIISLIYFVALDQQI